MKKTIIYFILTSIVKGALLFFIILLGDRFTEFPILLRFLIYFVLIGVFDWQILKQIKDNLRKQGFIRAFAFIYISFIATLWIAGPLFQLYNYVKGISVAEKLETPTIGMVIYLVFGLITTLITTIIWVSRNKKRALFNDSERFTKVPKPSA